MARAVSGTTRLYLVRHAHAGERGPAWPDDSRRPLSPKGVDRMKRVVGALGALGVGLDIVATSPLVRAEQTARLLVDGLAPESELVVLPALAPGGRPGETVSALAALPDARSIAVVGHEPDLGRLAGWLLGTAVPPVFKKGGICRLDLEGVPRAGAATLVWMATPKMLRAIRS